MKKIQVGSYDEWLKMALNQKFTISQTIVESILDNIDTKRKKLPIFEVEVESKGDIYTLSIETDQFVSTLETNLMHFENPTLVIRKINSTFRINIPPPFIYMFLS